MKFRPSKFRLGFSFLLALTLVCSIASAQVESEHFHPLKDSAFEKAVEVHSQSTGAVSASSPEMNVDRYIKQLQSMLQPGQMLTISQLNKIDPDHVNYLKSRHPESDFLQGLNSSYCLVNMKKISENSGSRLFFQTTENSYLRYVTTSEDLISKLIGQGQAMELTTGLVLFKSCSSETLMSLASGRSKNSGIVLRSGMLVPADQNLAGR
jgi:hypothetical protein